MSALLQVGLSNCVMALALAVVAASVGRWCRRPAVTHGLWLLVLLKLITPPLVFVPVSWPEPDAPAAPVVALAPVPLPIPEIPERVEEPIRPDVAPVEDGPDAWDNPGPADLPVPPAPEPPLVPAQLPPLPAVLAGDGAPWPTIALALWLGGSACWFVLALGRIRRFQRLLRHATTAPMELQVEAETLAARLGLARCPRVLLVHGVVSPMLWAVGQAPRLLLPASLLERVSAVQRATLLAHELAHLRRRDHVVRLLELVVLGLYWWFPLVWWARRELREAEEECCDAWVVWALPDSPRAYATALVETLDWLSEASPALPPVASGIGQLPLLRRRLTMIMRGTTPRALTGLGLLALLGLGLLLLPLVPSWAQPPGPGRPGVQPGGVRDVDLEKARAEVKRMAEDLKHLQESLEKQHRVMEIQAKRFADAMEWLKRAEFERAHQAEAKKEFGFKVGPGTKGDPEKKSGFTTGGGFGGTAGGPAHLERRLAEMEHKLDLVLRELQALRREAGKAHQGGPGIGPKGPFNPPTGPGGPGGNNFRPGGPGVGPGGFPPGGPGGGAPKPGFPGTPGGPPNPGADNVPAANPNPPAASVKGRITKIDKTDRTLVTISIGSDEGISTNNTLEVYRLQPTPQYLGRLLIRETRNHEAVGQLMKSSVQAGPLQEGDQVASSLQQ